MSIERIAVDRIRTDGGTQPRAALDEQVVAEYFDAQSRGDDFPPISVVYDGEHYWPYDGFHRIEVCRRAGALLIGAQVTQGTVEDARWLSYAANTKHGLRRSNGDKRRAVEAALRHSRSEKLSDRAVAEHCGVDHKTVSAIRSGLAAGGEIPHLKTRVGQDGKEYPAQRKAAPEKAEILASYPEPNEHGDFLPWNAYDWEEVRHPDPRLKDCWIRAIEVAAPPDAPIGACPDGKWYAVGWGARLGKRAEVVIASTETIGAFGVPEGAQAMVEWVEEVYPVLPVEHQALAHELLKWLADSVGVVCQEIPFREDPAPPAADEPVRPKLEVVPVSKSAIRATREAIEWLCADGPWLDHGIELRGQVDYAQVLKAMTALGKIRDAVRQMHAG